LVSNVLDDFSDGIVDLIQALKKERDSFANLGIDLKKRPSMTSLKQQRSSTT